MELFLDAWGVEEGRLVFDVEAQHVLVGFCGDRNRTEPVKFYDQKVFLVGSHVPGEIEGGQILDFVEIGGDEVNIDQGVVELAQVEGRKHRRIELYLHLSEY